MVQKWDTVSFPKPVAATKLPDHVDDNTDGIDTALTHNDGTSDPSSGAGWGAAHRGIILSARGFLTGASDTNPKLARWEDKDSGTGWRLLWTRKIRFATTPVTVSFSPGSPYTSNQAYTSLDLSTVLDNANLQGVESGFNGKLVTEVVLRVRVKDTGTFSGGDDAYAKFRGVGMTVEQKVYCAVSGRWNERTLIVPLDAAEALEWGVVVASGGSPSFTLEAEAIGFMETL